MSDFTTAARDKLTREFKTFNGSVKAAAIKKAVYDILLSFISQEPEFAQAVAQTDGTLAQCCTAAVKDCGNSISDIEVYRRAAGFYFPGATVRAEITIDLIGSAGETKPASSGGGIRLNLEDFL